VSEIITNAIIDIHFNALTPCDFVQPPDEMFAHAQEFCFDQIYLAKLGPDYEEAITVLARDLLPSIVQ